MKKLFPYITVALLFVGISAYSQVADTVTVQDETINSSSDPALLNVRAGQTIIIKPTTWIQSGTTFSAVITEDPYLLPSLDTNENYVFTRVYQEEKTSFDEVKNNSDVIESITYFDGLGRAKQQIGIKASPDKRDIVTHIAYDVYGRQDKQYLPFEKVSATNGAYDPVNIITDINAYYKNKYSSDFAGIDQDDTTNFNAYSESIFEPSPLNRVLEQGAPGKDWKADSQADTDHTIKFDWNTNLADEVAYFWVNFHEGNTEVPILVQEGNYDPNELLVTTTKDENWQPEQTHPNDHTTREYKDKLGRVILKRTFNDGIEHDTYYVYDDFGNLTYVIPPKVDITDGVSNIELAELCYQYIYDYRNRLVEKKIPGKDIEYIIYNKLDQPVMTQDGIQRPNKEWLFTKYDAFGRVAYTGLHEHSFVTTRAGLQQNAFNNSDLVQFETKQNSASSIANTTIYYSDNAYPDTKLIYTINYYDNYTFDHSVANPGTVFGQTVTSDVKGLPTGTKVRVLGTDDWITTVTYYDAKGRPIYVHSTNEYLNTVDIIESRLDFAGKVLETKTTHTKASNTPIVTVDTFTYDHMGRLLDQKQTINNQAQEHMVANTYDALGQLESKEVGGGLQKVDYTYNVRGWLKNINEGTTNNGDLFGFAINYSTTTENLGATPLYNGNISETSWKTVNDNIKRAYGYQYDALNRITAGLDNTTDRRYSLSSIAYDKNGNITALNRNGHLTENANSFGVMDQLTYNYNENEIGNQLTSVTDNSGITTGFNDKNTSGNDYLYDENGNMTKDNNKEISNITYNHLNLPTSIGFTDNSGLFPVLIGSISYTYDALGTKLSKRVTYNNGASNITSYAGNYIYEKSSISTCSGCPQPEEELKFFNHTEGYIEPNGNGEYDYVYQYKDHLGNIRLSYSDKNKDGNINVILGSAENEILEENNYYPFGLTHKGYNSTITGREHPYSYNGKEEQDELGLAWLDFGARNFDPALGRFMNMDRYSETFMPISPYQYGANNPILYLDYNGDYITIGIEDNDGNKYSVLYENGKTYHYSKDSDGNITKGEEYDGKDNGFLKQAIADLDKIGDTKQGSRIIGKLQESSAGYSISNSGNALDNSFDPNTNSISYSQDDAGRHDGVRFNKSHIKLGHELAHAYDSDRGFDMGSIALGGLPASEINAVKFENYLRAQDGETDMRLNYRFGGVNYGLSNALGGKSASYFNSYIAPLGRNEVYKRITPVPEFNPSIDNTYVRKPSIRRVYDTKKQKFVSFD
ncbi:DUF6443 domain-containing protein [uncultured Aquimarina sp.]|uniref:DUF6443 domain-containing protein n=1 Tax=uncultured Aquimarina sp. TaxID=575652 RepID=UPI00263024BA|nr:DUF6443 domain-containing protein [uncultured Aquimarina sp.]